MRTTSPATGSITDACVVTLVRVVVVVTVALCAIGGAAAGSPRAGSASPGGGGVEKRRPVAESGRDTSPGQTAVGRRDRSGVSERLEDWQ